MFFAGIYRDKDDVHKARLTDYCLAKERRYRIVQRNNPDDLLLIFDLNTRRIEQKYRVMSDLLTLPKVLNDVVIPILQIY